MADLTRILREEITRLTRRELKKPLMELRKDNAKLRKLIASLRAELLSLRKVSSSIRKTVRKSGIEKAVEEKQQQAASETKVRFSAESIRKLRAKLGLSQTDFGKLAGVSGQSVYLWEHATEPLKLRSKAKAALSALRGLGKREAQAKLAAMAE